MDFLEYAKKRLDNLGKPFKLSDDDNDIRVALDMPLRDILSYFGDLDSFKTWIKQNREIELVHLKRLETAEKEGRLVSRELVEKVVISSVNVMHKRLLSEGAKTIVHRLWAMCQAGKDLVEGEEYFRGQITKYIAMLKKDMHEYSDK